MMRTPRHSSSSWLSSRLVAISIVLVMLASTQGLTPSVSAQDVEETAATEVDGGALETIPTEAPLEQPLDGAPVEEIPLVEPESPVEAIPPVDEGVPTETLTAVEDTTVTIEETPVTEEPVAEPTAFVEGTIEPPAAGKEIDSGSPEATNELSGAALDNAEFGAAAVNLTVALTLSPAGTQPAGTAITGQASWASAPAGTPSGTIRYRLYFGSNCTGSLAAELGTRTIIATPAPNGSVAASTTALINDVGAYSWQADYSGDVNYNPGTVCTNQSIVKRTPTIALSVAPSPSMAGSALTGTSNLANLTSNATGSLTYTLYTNSTCTTTLTSTGSPNVKAVSGSVAPASDPLTVNFAPTVYWRVVYGGDADNEPATSPCVSAVVSKASPSIALTVAPGSITDWDTATGSAALSGATTAAGGSVVYTVHGDDGCGSPVTPAKTIPRTVSSGTVAAAAFTFDMAGVFYWQAVYGGDANNAGAESGCMPLTVVGGPLSASVSSAPVVYANVEYTNAGTMVLTVSDQRGTAEGWSVTLSVSDFDYVGVSPRGADIVAGSYAIQTANGPVRVSGQAISGTGGPGIPSGGATGPLSDPIVVLVAADGFGAGVYTQTYNVVLVIPAGSQVGTYVAVVDATTSAAP